MLKKKLKNGGLLLIRQKWKENKGIINKGGMMKPKLKPCPFCGCHDIEIDELISRNTDWESDSYGRKQHLWKIRCVECCISTFYYTRKKDVIRYWNKRSI